MTIFLIFICALLIVFALVLWGLGMVALRLAPIWVSIQRRKTSYREALLCAEKALGRSNAAVDLATKVDDDVQSLKQDALNEALNTRARR